MSDQSRQGWTRPDQGAPDTVDATVEEEATRVYPGQPYPGQPYPGQPAPYAPAYPAYPTYPAYPPAPVYGRPAYEPYEPDDEPRGPHPLAQPFPLWLTLGAPVTLAVTLAAVYLIETGLLGGDWATGALAISFTAFALALVTAGTLVGRVALGRRSFGAVALGGLLAVALVATGVTGQAQANPLRRAQASHFEAAGQWSQAIDEYAQAGEAGPNAPNIARVYTEWGEALLRGGDFAGATTKLTTVEQSYGQSGAIVARARADLFQTYSAWIKSGAITLPFGQSLAFLASYAKDPACASACQQSILDLTGQAHYQYGQQLAKAGQYKQAIAEFELTQSQYAKSAFAAPAHVAAAQTYWALGQQLLTQDCVSAIPTYQTLVSKYGDTSQGKQAKAALAASLTVKGVLTDYPNNPTPTLYLSRSINPSVNSYSRDYTATFDAQTGAFTFTKVTPGPYYLSTYRKISSTQEAFTYYKDTTSGKPYALQVGPLCTVDLGQLGY